MTTRIKTTFFWLICAGGMLWFLAAISSILLPFVLGMLVAYFLDPLVDRIQRLGMGRTSATALSTIVFFLLAFIFFGTLIPMIGEQLMRMLAELPAMVATISHTYQQQAQHWLSQLPAGSEVEFGSIIHDASGVLTTMLTTLAGGAFNSGAALLNLLSLLLITPVVAFYLLRDWDSITTTFDQLLPRTHIDVIHQQLQEIDRTISGFIRGQTIVCSALALFYIIGFGLVGLKYGLLIGALTGFLIIIPYVGWAAGATVAMAVAFSQYDEAMMIGFIGGILIVGQIIEGYLLTPKLVGDEVGLHPVWLIFGMLAGATLLGFVGVLIAIPATAVIGVLIRFGIGQYLTSGYYHGTVKPTAQVE